MNYHGVYPIKWSYYNAPRYAIGPKNPDRYLYSVTHHRLDLPSGQKNPDRNVHSFKLACKKCRIESAYDKKKRHPYLNVVLLQINDEASVLFQN